MKQIGNPVRPLPRGECEDAVMDNLARKIVQRLQRGTTSLKPSVARQLRSMREAALGSIQGHTRGPMQRIVIPVRREGALHQRVQVRAAHDRGVD